MYNVYAQCLIILRYKFESSRIAELILCISISRNIYLGRLNSCVRVARGDNKAFREELEVVNQCLHALLHLGPLRREDLGVVRAHLALWLQVAYSIIPYCSLSKTIKGNCHVFLPYICTGLAHSSS